MTTQLLSPYSLGSLKLKNRMVMAPMTRCRATEDHVPTELMVEYYQQRATAGLIITEGTAPDANGAGYARIPGLWSAEQVHAWKPIVAGVHAKGGKMAVQLMHTGRVSHPLNMPKGTRVLSPSATQAEGQMYTDSQGPQGYPVAEEMSEADIREAISGFVSAGKNAVEAGFDFVEIHGANGYLVEQFLCDATNQRTDSWGGEFSNRAKFVLEIVDGLAEAIGAEKVGIRLSPYGVAGGIKPWASIDEDYVWLAAQLSERGIGYLHMVDHAALGSPALPAGFKAKLRKAFSGNFILSGGYDKERAEAELVSDLGDLVAFGRPFLANPDLVERFSKQAPLNEARMDTFYAPGSVGYTDYPALG